MNKSGTNYESYPWVSYFGPTRDSGVQRIALPWYRNGADLPNYKQIIIDGGNATTALTAQRVNVASFNQGSFIAKKGTSKVYDIENTLCGLVYPTMGNPLLTVPALLVQDAQAQARTHALRKIRDLQTPFQAGVFGGEARELLRFLRSPLSQSFKLTESFFKAAKRMPQAFKKSADRKAAIINKGEKYVNNITKDMSDLWLQYRFGILPLVQDMKSIIELLKDKVDVETHFKNRTYGSSSTATTTVNTNFGIATNMRGIRSLTIENKAECFIHFGVMWELLNRAEEFHTRVADNLDSIEEVTITAWELLPFSFLVDYFVNVGDIISSSLTPQSTVNYSSESVVRTQIQQLALSDFRNIGSGESANNGVIVKSLPHVTVKIRRVDRVGGSIGVPPMIFHLPGSNIKYMNIAALLSSLNLRRS